MLITLYWQYSQALPWVLGLLLFVSGMSIWLYLPQIPAGGGHFRWAMPALRLVAMAALVVSILRPVVSRPRNEQERGPVVVLLDDSRSMGVVDTERPVGQWVAIAGALGRLPGSVRNADLQTMQNDCDRLSPLVDDVARARAERDYAKLSGGAIDSATTRLEQSVRELQSTAHDAAQRATQFAHGESLERTLAYLGAVPAGIEQEAWLDHIGDKARAASNEAEQDRLANDAALYHSDARVSDACEPLRAQSRFALSQTAVDDPAAGLRSRLGSTVPVVVYGIGERVRQMTASPSLVADGDSTNLTGGIRSVLSSMKDSSVRAVVLFSDGRQVDAEPSMRSIGGGVPIFTVAAAARRLRDVTIGECSVPSSAFVEEAINIHVVIRGFGLGGQATVVAFDDGAARQSRTVKFIDDRPMPVDFKWTPHAGGGQRLTVTAESLPGEISLINNRTERWVKVFDRKCRIGLAAGTDGPDIRVLRRAVSQSAWAELSLVSIGNSGAIAWSTDQIANCNVLVLTGLQANSFNALQWDAIASLVREQGGGIILVPDEDGSFRENNSVLAQMLPFARSGPTGWRAFPGDRGGFQLGPAPGVRILDFGDSGDAFWQALPPVSRYLPIAPLKPGVRSLLVESESGTPMLTESRQGRGRIFCVGTDETWRWRASNTEYPERFWRQFLRYVGGDPFQSRDGGVSLDAEPISVVPGRPVKFRVRVSSGASDPSSIKLAFLNNDKLVRERVVPAIQPRGSGLFETTLTDLPEGDYEVRADAGAALGSPRIRLHVQPSSEAEMADLTGDEGWLRHLAETSGGQCFRLDQLAQLAEKLRELPADLTHPVELPLWDGPYLYAIVLGCLATEWGLRKRFGLA